MKNRLKLALVLAFLIAPLLWITACSSGSQATASQQLVQAVKGDLAITVTGSGKIETSREARLTFGSAGKVDDILVEEGSRVSKGEVLARLDTNSLGLALSQAQVALTQAEVALTQARLAQKTAENSLKNTRGTEDSLGLALLNAQIGLEQAQRNLDAGITATDYDAIKAELNKAKVWYKYVVDSIQAGRGDIDDLTLELDQAKERLDAAQARYDNLLAGYGSQDIVIRKKQVEAAEMAVTQAQNNLDNLVDSVTIQELQVESARQSVGHAEQSVELARLSLAEARRQLDEATIVAPFDGVIAQVLAKEGDIVPSPSMAPTAILHLIDPSQMGLVIEVDELDIPQVKPGQEAIISVDALTDAEFSGGVVSIYPVPKEVGGVVLYNVKLDLEVSTDSGIKTGMSASADILIEKHGNILLVPSRAIGKDSQGNTIVKVMVGEQVQERPVVTGLDDGLRIEIISGLSENETVVVELSSKSGSSLGFFGQ